MQIRLRYAHIGVAISTTLMLIGCIVVGPGASDREVELICYPAIALGLAVMAFLYVRDELRERRHHGRR